MKVSQINKALSAGVLTLALSANLLLAADGAARISPPNSSTHGKTLTEWLGAYWAWYYGGVPADGMVDGVFLMPLPASEQISGSWIPSDPAYMKGTLEITVKPGTPFVLPLFAWVGERYKPELNIPDDPPMSDAVMLSSLTPTLKIDGKTMISNQNKAAFYIPPTYWDEMVVYPQPTAYGSFGALFFQSVGFVSPPLPVGKHVIKLYETIIIPPGDYPLYPNGLGLIYDNTWNITVSPK